MKYLFAYSMIAGTTLILTACAVNKIPQPISGSKADGTVVLAYDIGLLEQPIIDSEQAQKTARKRCRAWGYKNADPFGGRTAVCSARNLYGECTQNQVSMTYQCTD